MVIDFMEYKLSIKDSDIGNKNRFSCKWNGYRIDVNRANNCWIANIKGSNNKYIVIGIEDKKLKTLIQKCFDIIDGDISYMGKEVLVYQNMIQNFYKNIDCSRVDIENFDELIDKINSIPNTQYVEIGEYNDRRI